MIQPENWELSLNGREIVVWGTGRDAPSVVRHLRNAGKTASFFVSRDWRAIPEFMGGKVVGKELLDASRHFVVIGTSLFSEVIAGELCELGFSQDSDFAVWSTAYISNSGISKEKLSCHLVTRRLYLEGNEAGLCCFHGYKYSPPKVRFAGTESSREKVQAIQELRERTRTALLHGKPCSCTYCPRATMEPHPEPLTEPINLVNLAFANRCNLRCLHCSQQWKMEKPGLDVNSFDASGYRALFEELRRVGLLGESNFTVEIASGEITIHPKRAEILSLLGEFNCQTLIASNCVTYDNELVNHLSLGRTILNCSVDSGTRVCRHNS